MPGSSAPGPAGRSARAPRRRRRWQRLELGAVAPERLEDRLRPPRRRACPPGRSQARRSTGRRLARGRPRAASPRVRAAAVIQPRPPGRRRARTRSRRPRRPGRAGRPAGQEAAGQAAARGRRARAGVPGPCSPAYQRSAVVVAADRGQHPGAGGLGGSPAPASARLACSVAAPSAAVGRAGAGAGRGDRRAQPGLAPAAPAVRPVRRVIPVQQPVVARERDRGHQPLVVRPARQQVADAEVAGADPLAPRHPGRREQGVRAGQQHALAHRDHLGPRRPGHRDRPAPAA